MSETSVLTVRQTDGLREAANIGAGHAATALSMLTGSKVLITVPHVVVSTFREIRARIAVDESSIVAVEMAMTGDLVGESLIVIPGEMARTLTSRLLRSPGGDRDTLRPLEESTLQEVANIVVGAYLTALGEFLSLRLMQSPPRLTSGAPETVLGNVRIATERVVVCVENEFILDDTHGRQRSYFLMLPEADSVRALLNAFKGNS